MSRAAQPELAYVLVEYLGSLLVTSADRVPTLRPGWERGFATFLRQALLEEPARITDVPRALGAVAVALSERGAVEPAQQIVALTQELLGRLSVHAGRARTAAERERRQGATLIGAPQPLYSAPVESDDAVKATPLARFHMSAARDEP